MENLAEEQFFDELYRQMYQRLYLYACNVVGDYGLAEDAVQEIFLLAYSKKAKLLQHPNPQGWLMQALKNNIQNQRRRKHDITRMLFQVPLDDWLQHNLVDDEFTDNIDLLYGDMAGLPEYELLKKYAVEKCSVAELAQEYGISINYCKQMLFRARKKLRKYFK